MAVAQSFCAFFGCTKIPGGGSGDGPNYTTNDSIEYAGNLQLQHFGKSVDYIEENGDVDTITALIHKERKEKLQTEYGFDEMILRDLGFSTKPEFNGREVVHMFAEMRINGVKYQVVNHQLRSDFWHVTLKRINVGEVSRSNRRGKT